MCWVEMVTVTSSVLHGPWDTLPCYQRSMLRVWDPCQADRADCSVSTLSVPGFSLWWTPQCRPRFPVLQEHPSWAQRAQPWGPAMWGTGALVPYKALGHRSVGVIKTPPQGLNMIAETPDLQTGAEPQRGGPIQAGGG